MSLYDVDYNNVWQQNTPQILRGQVQLAWGKVLLKPLQYLHDLIFTDYANGSFYPNFDITSAYTLSDRVIYIDRGVYECNSGTTAGIVPFNLNYWRKINDNYIGANERVLYNANKIVYEYALNRWFQTGISNPSPGNGIYIDTLTASTIAFLMGNSGPTSSVLYNSSKLSTSYLVNYYSGSNSSDYLIWVPNAIYNALGPNDTFRTNTVRSIADKYNIAGMLYSVSGY